VTDLRFPESCGGCLRWQMRSQDVREVKRPGLSQEFPSPLSMGGRVLPDEMGHEALVVTALQLDMKPRDLRSWWPLAFLNAVALALTKISP